MNLSRLCQRAIVTVDAQRPAREAALAMLEQHVGAVVVTAAFEGRTEIVGLLTDRDLAIACVARSLDPAEVRAGAVASRPVICIAASCGPDEAARAMHASGVRRLLVRDGDAQGVGLLSSDDLLAALASPLQSWAESFGAGIDRESAHGADRPYDAAAAPLVRRRDHAPEAG